jgi:hypothetical protein
LHYFPLNCALDVFLDDGNIQINFILNFLHLEDFLVVIPHNRSNCPLDLLNVLALHYQCDFLHLILVHPLTVILRQLLSKCQYIMYDLGWLCEEVTETVEKFVLGESFPAQTKFRRELKG